MSAITTLITKLVAAQTAVSNQNPPLTQAAAQSTFATQAANAIDEYVEAVGDSTRINSMKTQLLALVSELVKLQVVQGTNLDPGVLTNLTENINDI